MGVRSSRPDPGRMTSHVGLAIDFETLHNREASRAAGRRTTFRSRPRSLSNRMIRRRPREGKGFSSNVGGASGFEIDEKPLQSSQIVPRHGDLS